jgi:hypothetical protein
MKISTLLSLSLLLLSCSSVAEENFFTAKNADIQPVGPGCTIAGSDEIFVVGTRKQMNHKELALYKAKTGYNPSDGYAVMMSCLYLVNPLSVDHPAVSDREYVWVAY